MPDLPSGARLDWGLFRFTVTGVPVGDKVAIQLYLPPTARPDVYYKYGPTSDHTADHWYEFDYDSESGLGMETDLNVVTLHLKDGGWATMT